MLANKRLLIMGLLDTSSIAWAIGNRAKELGAEVIYTVQSSRFRDVLLKRAFQKEGLKVEDYQIHACDVTSDSEIESLFRQIGKPLHGLVHSIAYANPKTCLTNNMFDAPRADLTQGFEISAASLALVLKSAQTVLAPGSGVVALSFNTQTAFPGYDWMGVNKAALEAITRYTARDLGPKGIRVNCVSSGPLHTKAASSIPGFNAIRDSWSASSPLGWNADEDHVAVADATLFLLSDLSRKITGEVIYVDGGFHAMRGISSIGQ